MNNSQINSLTELMIFSCLEDATDNSFSTTELEMYFGTLNIGNEVYSYINIEDKEYGDPLVKLYMPKDLFRNEIVGIKRHLTYQLQGV